MYPLPTQAPLAGFDRPSSLPPALVSVTTHPLSRDPNYVAPLPTQAPLAGFDRPSSLPPVLVPVTTHPLSRDPNYVAPLPTQAPLAGVDRPSSLPPALVPVTTRPMDDVWVLTQEPLPSIAPPPLNKCVKKEILRNEFVCWKQQQDGRIVDCDPQECGISKTIKPRYIGVNNTKLKSYHIDNKSREGWIIGILIFIIVAAIIILIYGFRIKMK